MRGKYEAKRKKAPFWYYALLILLVGVFGFSTWYLADYFVGSARQAGEYQDLAALVEANRPTVPVKSNIQPEVNEGEDGLPGDEVTEDMETVPTENLHDENGILLEYAPLYELNPDMVGWLSIEGTKVNYPVMQTPDRPDYYLKRDFKGAYSDWGCIYAREECDIEEPSDNITLYGHNMKDGSMFAGLNGYTKREFWEEHRYIRFDTLTEHRTYAVFAVFKTTASQGKGFEYHEFINAGNEMEFDTFIARCLSLSFYGTDLIPEYGDKIICLSTCEYTQTNGRLVVAAVRID